jgi:hypothetical protein
VEQNDTWTRRASNSCERHLNDLRKGRAFINHATYVRIVPAVPEQDAGCVTHAFSEADLSLYTDFVHPAGWDRKSVRLFLDQRFKRNPAIAPIIRRCPPFFGSNHAPFLYLRRESAGLPPFV